jgi:hypothetical protein
VQVPPDKRDLPGKSTCRALFEIWDGDNAVIPEAKGVLLTGIQSLDSDKQERDEFKPGGRGLISDSSKMLTFADPVADAGA